MSGVPRGGRSCPSLHALYGTAGAVWNARAVIARLGPVSYEVQTKLHSDGPRLSPLATVTFHTWQAAFVAARQQAFHHGYDMVIRDKSDHRLQLLCWRRGRVGESNSCCPVIRSFIRKESSGGWTLWDGVDQQHRSPTFDSTTSSAPWLTTLTGEEEVYVGNLRQSGLVTGSDEFEEVSMAHEIINQLRKGAGKPLLLSTRALQHLWTQTKGVTVSPTPAPCRFWPPPSAEGQPAASSPCKFWPPPPPSPSTASAPCKFWPPPAASRPSSRPATPQQALPASAVNSFPATSRDEDAPASSKSLALGYEGGRPTREAGADKLSRVGDAGVSSERKSHSEPLIPLLQAHRVGPNIYFANSTGITFSRSFESRYPWSGLETYAETTASAKLLLPRCLIAVDVEATQEYSLPPGTRLVRQARPDLWVLERPEKR